MRTIRIACTHSNGRRALPVAALLLAAALPAAVHAAVIIVPDEHPTIQAAVDAAAPGDTIQVRPGTYPEGVDIEEGKNNLVLEGLGGRPMLTPALNDEGIHVDGADGVTIRGMDVSGGNRAVRLDFSDGSSVSDMVITGSKEGIRLRKGIGFTVDGNTITNATSGRGIRVDDTPGAVVTDNTVSGSSKEGIRVRNSAGAQVTGNMVDGAGTDGIRVHKSPDATVAMNTADTSNGNGIRVVRSADLALDGNDADGNGKNGIYVDRSECVLSMANNNADGNGQYGMRVKKSPPIASDTDLITAGNTASGNTDGNFLVQASSVPCPNATPTATVPIVTATPTLTVPVVTATPTLTVTPTPTLTANATLTATPTPTAAATPTVTVTSTPGVTVTATPTATATPGCGNGMIDPGEDCDPPGSTTCPAGTAGQLCSMTCQCACPERIDFEAISTDANSELDTGWKGIAHDAKVVSEGKLTVDITSCPGSSRPCGTCTITGPIDNPAPDAGDINNKRCRNESWIKCNTIGVDPLCTGGGNACVYYFGAPLPLSAGGVSTCVSNEVVGSITGTANIETGESASQLSLTSRVFTGILADKPCPQCTDAGPLNDGLAAGGTCNDGPRLGQPCDANGAHPIATFGRTSLDCPSPGGALIASLPINLRNSTDPETRTLTAANPFCTAFGATSQRCPCDTCDNPASTPCSSNADCSGGICGGLRCLSDSGGAAGTPCIDEGENIDAACGIVGPGACVGNICNTGPTTGGACMTDDECGGNCGRPGEATRPNDCSNGQCITGGGTDDGQCQLAPTDPLCGPTETFRGCTGNPDCTFPGDTCGTKRRECLFNLDQLAGPSGAMPGASITVNGMEDTPVNDMSTPILASLFCIGPTGSSAVNGVAGLPGLGKLRLRGNARGLP